MRRALQTLLILLPALSLSATAGVMEFTDRAAWLAAAGAVTKH